METVAHLFTLSTTLQQTYRTLQINRFNRQLSTSNVPSLLCLPDDILLIIFDYLQSNDRQVARIVVCPKHAKDHKNRHKCTFQYRDGDFVRFSMSNRRIRGLAESRLFRTVRMASSWSAERASKALQSLEASGSARHYTKELKMDIWAGVDVEQMGVTTKNLLKLGQSFVQATMALENLERMTLTVPAATALALQTAFKESGGAVVLPNVREYVLSPFMHWIVEFCPNLRSIESNDWVLEAGIARHDRVQAIIDSAAKAPLLEHFSLHCRWRIDLVNRVVERLPNLKSLAMRGGHYAADMKGMLGALKGMRRLERLELLDANQVGQVLHSNSPWLSPYCWKDGVTECQRNVTGRVFQELSSLRMLSLGVHFQARLLSREAKTIDVCWDTKWQKRAAWQLHIDCELSHDFDQSIREWMRMRYHLEGEIDQKLQKRLQDDDGELQLWLMQEEMNMEDES